MWLLQLRLQTLAEFGVVHSDSAPSHGTLWFHALGGGVKMETEIAGAGLCVWEGS